MKLILLASFVALTGCTSARLLPTGVSGNEAFVSVSNVWNSAQALPYAEKHCAKYGRIPRLNRSEGYASIFDCVASTASAQPSP